jgi:hypothetical protein
MRFFVPVLGEVLAVMLCNDAHAQPGPWQRTEVREDCAQFGPGDEL